MKVVILAGGFGSRMSGICSDIPKSMLEFNRRPFLEYLVTWLIRIGVQEILISSGFLGEKIEAYFGTDVWSDAGVKVMQEEKPLGTGGAVRFIAAHARFEEVFLCNADTLVEFDFHTTSSLATMLHKPIVSVVTTNEGAPNQGAIKIEHGIVTEFQEDGITRALEHNQHFFRASSTGCYFIQRSLLISDVFRFGASLEKEILPSLVEQRLLGAVSCGTGIFLDYGSPQRFTLLKNNPWMLEKVYGFLK
jgi:NDP-sugar pyrophosphorylase family protein